MVATIAVGLGAYRFLNPPPVYPIPTYGLGGTFYSHAFQYEYSVEVTDEAMDRAPTWNRRKANPPLSANEAMVRAELVRKRLLKEKKLVDDIRYGEWALTAAELTPYDETRGQWFWLVHFEYVMDQTGPPHELRLIVLMDGTVIQPTVTKRG